MRCVRSLSSVQARAQHVPRALFVANANLSVSLLASDKIDGLYSQVQLPGNKSFFRHVTALKKIAFEKTALANEPTRAINSARSTARVSFTH